MHCDPTITCTYVCDYHVIYLNKWLLQPWTQLNSTHLLIFHSLQIPHISRGPVLKLGEKMRSLLFHCRDSSVFVLSPIRALCKRLRMSSATQSFGQLPLYYCCSCYKWQLRFRIGLDIQLWLHFQHGGFIWRSWKRLLNQTEVMVVVGLVFQQQENVKIWINSKVFYPKAFRAIGIDK